MIEFNPRTGRYRDLRTGRFIGWNAVEAIAVRDANKTERDLIRIFKEFKGEKIDQYEFERRLHQRLKESYIVQTALGKGGVSQLTKKDYGTIGNNLKEYYRRSEKSIEGFVFGEVSEKQLVSRIKNYARNSHIQYQIAHVGMREKLGYEGWRSLNTNANHCGECISHQTLGYVSAKKIVPLGYKCGCRMHCKCRIKWRKVKNISDKLPISA